MNMCIYDCVYHQGDDDSAKFVKDTLREVDIDIYSVVKNEFPSNPEKYDSFYITGSKAFVFDQYPWIKRLESQLEVILRLEKPILGICFGHQLLAKLLGGVVESIGRYVTGYHPIELTENGQKHPLFNKIPKNYFQYFSQEWTITNLPKSSILLATNKNGVEAFQYGNTVFGLQSHPDMTHEMAELRSVQRKFTLKKLDEKSKHYVHSLNTQIVRNYYTILKSLV